MCVVVWLCVVWCVVERCGRVRFPMELESVSIVAAIKFLGRQSNFFYIQLHTLAGIYIYDAPVRLPYSSFILFSLFLCVMTVYLPHCPSETVQNYLYFILVNNLYKNPKDYSSCVKDV